MAPSFDQDGSRRVVNEKASARNVGRSLPPVSSATGGVRAGINLDDSAILQDTDDLLDEPRQSAEEPTIDELRARLTGRRKTEPSVSPADVVRAERDRLDGGRGLGRAKLD